MVTCECETDTEVSQTVYHDPRTGRHHEQWICNRCGKRVPNPDTGRMV